MSNSDNDLEIESKFYVRDLKQMEPRLLSVGAQCIQKRQHELNLRFDLPDGSLGREHRVLRLRRDDRVRLTYKGPAIAGQEVSTRQEIEFEVGDYDAARRFLEALGYQVIASYEKYRTTYEVGGVEVMLDELPYGSFVEIEGAHPDQIQIMAALLRLKWEARISASYLALFERVKEVHPILARNLTFAGLSGVEISAQDLDVTPAD